MTSFRDSLVRSDYFQKSVSFAKFSRRRKDLEKRADSFPPWNRNFGYDFETTSSEQLSECSVKTDDFLNFDFDKKASHLRHHDCQSSKLQNEVIDCEKQSSSSYSNNNLHPRFLNRLPATKIWLVSELKAFSRKKRRRKFLKRSRTFHSYGGFRLSATYSSIRICQNKRDKLSSTRAMERLKASVLCKEVSDLAKDQLDIILDREDLNSDYVSNITDNFEVIKEASQSMVSKLVTIEDNLAPRFDFDENTRANGFWSLCRICKLCLMRLQELINYVTSYHYQSTLLKTKNPLRDLQAYAQCLSALGKCLDFVVANEELFIQGNNLIISLENHPQKLIEELYDSFEELPRAPFYGRTIGFHYDPSLVNPLLAIVVSELSYAELYESNGFARKATAFLSGGKFYLNNKLRGYAMDVLSRLCDMSFGKSFWSLTELNMIQHVPSLVCNSVEVNRVIELEKTTLFMMPPVISAGKMFEPVEVPYPHTSESKGENSPPFFMRLISYLTREGMVPETSVISTSGTQVAVAATGVLQGYPIPTTATLVNPMGAMTSAVTSQATAALTNATKAQKKKNPNIAPLSDAIVIHCHGGGFVSQSSRSHEIYLRSWAKALNIPIVAIDYSLAPEHPFPTAVDESFYCYCWILNNLEKLGCKRSAKICLVGDSAGGNLVLAIALRCIQTYIRKPDGIVAVYPAVFPQYALSPSRVLSVMDCLLAVGILDQCLLAYLGEEDPLPSFKLSRVLEHYQGEWEYR